MLIYDLSPEGIEKFEKENLIFTIDEMLAMDNKKRRFEIMALTFDESWVEVDKKVNTARSLAFLIEFENGWLETTFGLTPTFMEQYFIIKLIKRGETIAAISRKLKRSRETIHAVMEYNNVTRRSSTLPKVVIIEKHNGEIIEMASANMAAHSEYCDIHAITLRKKLRSGSYTNDIAKFYYKKFFLA